MATEKKWYISIKTILIFFLSFILGFIVNSLYISVQNVQTSDFKPVDLINFVISIILSSSSIILAIVAISLGKDTEEILLKRNDESIKLQNETYHKTLEALTRIQSSTGVTEKRIEDIIAGRVGDISQIVAEKISGDRGLRRTKKEIETEIKNSLLDEISIERQTKKPEEIEQKKKEDKMIEDEYKVFHQKMLSAFANRKDLHVIKTSHGDYSANSTEDYFDGFFLYDGKKIGVCAIPRNKKPSSDFKEYLLSIGKEIIKGNLYKALIFFLDDYIEILRTYINEDFSFFANNPKDNIVLLISSNDIIEKQIEELTI